MANVPVFGLEYWKAQNIAWKKGELKTDGTAMEAEKLAALEKPNPLKRKFSAETVDTSRMITCMEIMRPFPTPVPMNFMSELIQLVWDEEPIR